MWLLSTSRAELKYFVSPEEVIRSEKRGFAILSHTWGDHEQSFQDVQAKIREAAKTGENPRELLSAKIRECCKLAEREEYKWVWIDTCCIDKTSSAELSEAINSMYRYYSLSSVCYVYLEDWHGNKCTPVGAFSRCRWFYRCWTLQELIAPKSVLFFNYFWRLIGTKSELSYELNSATCIPPSILSFRLAPNDFPIAQRMSWASKREATRPEDEAYSLLGIFDVNMPTIYGEGRKAFQRLQQEIMHRNPDPTLFAWGPISSPATLESQFKSCKLVSAHGLNASCPADFEGSPNIEYPTGGRIIPRISVTPFGAHVSPLRLACMSPNPDNWSSNVFLADFLLQDSQTGRPLYVVFVSYGRMERNSYVVGGKFSSRDGQRTESRIVRMDVQDQGTLASLEWKVAEADLLVYATPSQGLGGPTQPDALSAMRNVIADGSFPFRIPSLRITSGYFYKGALVSLIRYYHSMEMESHSTETESRYFLLDMFYDTPDSYRFFVTLSSCSHESPEPVPQASVVRSDYPLKDPTGPCPCDCVQDHVLDWPDLTKRFVVTTREFQPFTVTLRFSRTYDYGQSVLWMHDIEVDLDTTPT